MVALLLERRAEIHGRVMRLPDDTNTPKNGTPRVPADDAVTAKNPVRVTGLNKHATVAEAIIIADTRDAKHAKDCPAKREIRTLRVALEMAALAVLAVLAAVLWWRFSQR